MTKDNPPELLADAVPDTGVSEAMLEAGMEAFTKAHEARLPFEIRLRCAYRAMVNRDLAMQARTTVEPSDPWQPEAKVRWVRQLDRRPVAVLGLDELTIASRLAPLSVTLKECPGVIPLGWLELVRPEPTCRFCGQPERAHEPSRCCGDGGGSTFEATVEPTEADVQAIQDDAMAATGMYVSEKMVRVILERATLRTAAPNEGNK